MEEKTIEIKCNCGAVDEIDLSQENLVWNIVETDEREMGTEFTHEAEVCHQCSICHEQITIFLRVWEYPDGAYNDEDIEVIGGELVRFCQIGDLVL